MRVPQPVGRGAIRTSDFISPNPTPSQLEGLFWSILPADPQDSEVTHATPKAI